MKFVCRSRRHWWMREHWAERCCNGWTLVFRPTDDFETTGTLERVLVPNADVDTIARHAKYVPLEASSSTPLEPWSKLLQ